MVLLIFINYHTLLCVKRREPDKEVAQEPSRTKATVNDYSQYCLSWPHKGTAP